MISTLRWILYILNYYYVRSSCSTFIKYLFIIFVGRNFNFLEYTILYVDFVTNSIELSDAKSPFVCILKNLMKPEFYDI